MTRASIVLMLVIAFASLPAAAQDVVAGRASVVDGDSLEIHGERIRLHGKIISCFHVPISDLWFL